MFLLKPKFIIMLAIVSGLLATVSVSRYIGQQEVPVEEIPVIETQPVVVASHDLPLGTILIETNLRVGEWPVDIIPAGSIDDPRQLVGRVLKTDVSAGEAVLEAKLAPEGTAGGVTGLIPPGMRAITVAVNVVSGVGGFILPNARVDILATFEENQNRDRSSTKTILQNVKVLAIDQTYHQDDNDPVTVKSVTLLLTPEEAEKLSLAANQATLHLALRNDSDTEKSETSGVVLNQIKLKPAPAPRRYRPRKTVQAPPPKEEPQARVVEIYRSNVRSEVSFEEEEEESKKN